MGLLPDTQNCRLRMRRECQERFSPPPRVSDHDMHQGTCVTHVSWCMPGSLTSGFLWSWENVPGIPGTCATRNFAHLVREAHDVYIWWNRGYRYDTCRCHSWLQNLGSWGLSVSQCPQKMYWVCLDDTKPVSKLGKYLQVRRTICFWTLRAFQMFTGHFFE